MSLQILQWLPSIPWDLSFCVGVPSMFAYGPEVYQLHSWGGMGDGTFNLDTDTHAINLLTQKLVELHDGAGSDKVFPSRGPSLTGSTAPWCTASSLARSCSVTPSHRTSPTQPISDMDKVSEVELRNQWCQDAQLLDKDFSTWHDQKIGEGCEG